MDKKKILAKVKRSDEEKVAVSLRLPITLKEELQQYCDSENISMNALIIETMYAFIDDECGLKLRASQDYLRERLNRLLWEIDDIEPDPENIEYYKRISKEISLIKDMLH